MWEAVVDRRGVRIRRERIWDAGTPLSLSPFDVDGEELQHLQSAPADGGCKGLALTVAEEKHLQHVRVVHGHAATCHLAVTVLQDSSKDLTYGVEPSF